jgi:hypothetical protein
MNRRLKQAGVAFVVACQPEQQRVLLIDSCQDVMQGKMPGPYTLLHPEMRLSAQDVETICAAAREAEAEAAGR